MDLRNIYQTVRNFLFSSVNKQFLVFMFFLVLSGIFWLMMTLNENYERELKVPVEVTGVPKSVVLTSASVDTVRVSIRDKGWMLLGYLYGKRLRTIGVNFRTFDKGDGNGSVAAADIKRLLEQQLETSSRVTNVKPDKLEFYYNNGERKRVPVRWAGRIIPEQLYFISHVDYKPDSVDVYASEEKLDSIRVIYTEPLNYVGFRDTLMVQCRLSHTKDVKVVPEHVRIGFYTDVLTEESIDGVAIQSLNVPEGKVLRTFPAKVSVRFVAGVSQIRQLRPEDFVVVADYNEIMQNPADKCNIYLRKSPHGISRAALDIKQVDYLIEED